jgi:hypothetical protein
MTEADIRAACEEAWERAYPDCRIAWMRNRFTRLLDAEAWLDAAMMLRLEGHRIKMTICEDGRSAADTWVHGADPDPVGPSPLYDTPAEALLAAIEKVRT